MAAIVPAALLSLSLLLSSFVDLGGATFDEPVELTEFCFNQNPLVKPIARSVFNDLSPTSSSQLRDATILLNSKLDGQPLDVKCLAQAHLLNLLARPGRPIRDDADRTSLADALAKSVPNKLLTYKYLFSVGAAMSPVQFADTINILSDDSSQMASSPSAVAAKIALIKCMFVYMVQDLELIESVMVSPQLVDQMKSLNFDLKNRHRDEQVGKQNKNKNGNPSDEDEEMIQRGEDFIMSLEAPIWSQARDKIAQLMDQNPAAALRRVANWSWPRSRRQTVAASTSELQQQVSECQLHCRNRILQIVNNYASRSVGDTSVPKLEYDEAFELLKCANLMALDKRQEQAMLDLGRDSTIQAAAKRIKAIAAGYLEADRSLDELTGTGAERRTLQHQEHLLDVASGAVAKLAESGTFEAPGRLLGRLKASRERLSELATMNRMIDGRLRRR